jgi:hypothetical protein
MQNIIGLILILMFLWFGFALRHLSQVADAKESPKDDTIAPLLHRSAKTTSKPNVRSMLADDFVTPSTQRDNKHVLAESDNGTITPASSPKAAHTDLHHSESALVAAVPPPSPPVLSLEPLKPPVPGNTSSRIPHKMWFTYSHNLLETNEPSLLAANVRHTIDAYRQAWDEASAEINVYNDTMCRALLQKVEPLLLVYFDGETQGMYRGDVCRTAILYMFGGYYFDLDLEVITPVLLKDSDTFATVTVDKKNVFQAFLAGTPKHPIFRKALDLMLEYYKKTRKPNGWMGTITMRAALDSVVKAANVVERGEIFLLEEVNGGNKLYPELEGWTKRENAKGCCCNFVVHNGTTPFFYSRIVGVNFCQTPVVKHLTEEKVNPPTRTARTNSIKT